MPKESDDFWLNWYKNNPKQAPNTRECYEIFSRLWQIEYDKVKNPK